MAQTTSAIVHRVCPALLLAAALCLPLSACDDEPVDQDVVLSDAPVDAPDAGDTVDTAGEADTSGELDTRADVADTTDLVPDGVACGFGSCASDQACCDYTCTDIDSDPANCGGCGLTCDQDEQCVDGRCTCADEICADNELCCPGQDGPAMQCLDVVFDRRNCGGCGVSCAPAEQCVGGTCACFGTAGVVEVCTQGSACCPGSGCRDLDNDARNCGGCGVSCGPGEQCVGGQCQCGTLSAQATGPACAADEACCGEPAQCHPLDDQVCQCGTAVCGTGQTCCEVDLGGVLAEQCIHVGRDPGHCGGCGQLCAAFEACQGGQCQCMAGFDDCDGNPSNGCETRLDADSSACGACDSPCPGGEVCDGTGQCTLTCADGFDACAGVCTDTDTNPTDCGACGNACPAGQRCDGTGQCDVTCLGGFTDCSGLCVALNGDSDHCGACANACPPGSVCNGQAQCSPNCQSGWSICEGDCVDTDTDRRHCGTCANVCPSGQVCDGTGSCALDCQTGYENCGGTCSNIATDARHCGACGNACLPGFACVGAQCQPDCAAGLLTCGGTCVDPSVSPLHCGACGNACEPGFRCEDGACTLTCPATQQACAGQCVDVDSNQSHCGACGAPCQSGQICIAGACQDAGGCVGGELPCGGNCVDVLANDTHCGACDNACAAGQACVDARCVCDPRFGDCDLDVTNGCEIDLFSDADHCGGCGLACAAGLECVGAQCRCTHTRGDCDGDATNGCETDLLDDADHCGACGQACASDEACRLGVCAELPAIPSAVVDLTRSGRTFAQLDDGSVWWWGNGAATWGTPDVEIPEPVPGLDGSTRTVTAIGAGGSTLCAVLDDGAVACLGASLDPTQSAPVTSATEVAGLGPAAPAVAVAVGTGYACAVLAAGTVRCWGDNQSDRLGVADGLDRTTPDTDVGGIDGVSSRAVAVSVADAHACARLDDGRVLCWGDNSQGQLGAGTSGLTTSPTAIAVDGLDDIVDLHAGAFAIRASGQLVTWGRNSLGPTPIALQPFGRVLPALRFAGGCALANGGTLYCRRSDDQFVPTTGAPPVFDADGHGNGCIVDLDGRILCTGVNTDLHLGRPATDVAISQVLLDAADFVGAVEVVTGHDFKCARTGGGTVLCAGEGDELQLGEPGDHDLHAIVPLPAPATALAAGKAHACAVLAGGALYCWGRDANGQLGTGTAQATGGRPPGVVLDIDGTSQRAVAVAAGESNTCALLDTGAVWCWGGDSALGRPIGSLTPGTTPAPVFGLDGSSAQAVEIDVGFRSACARLTDGTVRCWGTSTSGAQGDGTFDAAPTPVVVADLDGVGLSAIDIAVGNDFACAVVDDATVRCWGRNHLGQLGSGVGTNSASPVTATLPVGVSAPFADLDAFGPHACLVAGASGEHIVCWGSANSPEAIDCTACTSPPPACQTPPCGNVLPHLLTHVQASDGFTTIATEDLQTCALRTTANGTTRLACAGGANGSPLRVGHLDFTGFDVFVPTPPFYLP